MQDRSLYEALAEIPDPRFESGQRHPLAALLTHAAVAMLAGAQSLAAIAQFGRERGEAFAEAVGYTHRPLPCKATFSNVFRVLDVAAFEAVLRAWLTQREAAGWRAVALDGKTLAGSAEGEVPGLHLLAAYAHEAQAAIGQMAVDAKTNEHKRALQLLEVLPVEGTVVTGDAMFCQRDLSAKVLREGGIIAGRSRTTSPS